MKRVWLIEAIKRINGTQILIATRIGVSQQRFNYLVNGQRGTCMNSSLLFKIAEAVNMPLVDAVQAEADYLEMLKASRKAASSEKDTA